jgi:membrane fusion protein (multidrug efflux system)
VNSELLRRTIGSILYPSLLLAVLALAACGKDEPAAAGDAAAQAPPAEVVVTKALRTSMPLDFSYTASTRGSREVEVRSRVSGILLSRKYQEGAFVKEGTVLFTIDPLPFKAAADSAAGALEMEKARLTQAEREKDRIGPLYEKRGVSQRERDDTISAYEVAKASVAAAEARLQQARLELGYTSVRAPISGFTGKETRSEGSLVQAGGESSLLTTIVRLDPLYVEFSMPDSEVRLLRQVLAADGKGGQLAVPVTLLLDDSGRTHPVKATLDFLDSAIEGSSSTVRARASLPNPEHSLLPGQFLRVRLDGLALRDAVVIPTRALGQGPTGPFVWVVPADNVPVQTPVSTGFRSGDKVAIEKGLAGGEDVVIEGLQKIFPGAPVKPLRDTEAPAPAVDPAAPAAAPATEAPAGGNG